ncbi:MAG: Ig-like domain-containing protein [Bryobacteraceae bacterium]|nr:Ig-like domain-containing protein [Bryobacteraceae bacterium]
MENRTEYSSRYLLLLALFTLLPYSAMAQKDRTGEWGPIISWPHIPVAMGHFADGRIVSWASTRPTTFPAGATFTYAAVFNPNTNAINELNNLKHDMFCAGIATSADGRIIAAGGGATIRTTSFIGMSDVWGQYWVQSGNMNQGRWYNTSVTLPDGNILTWWGRGGNGVAEIWDANTGVWTEKPSLNALSTADPEDGVEDENQLYPNLHVMPDGRLFNSGPLKSLYLLDWRGAGSIQAAGSRTPDGIRQRKLGFAVMYRPGKILYTGGRDDRFSPSVTNTAVTIDLNSGTPVVTQAANMNYARAFHYSVLLPNGEVMALGGNTSGVKFSDNGGVLMPEVWNPDTNIWRTVAPMTEPRGYHMTALLMRDGRVMIAGGGLCGCEADHQSAQIYSPWYLFNADGSPAARPVITSAAANLKAGLTFNLQGSDDIASFNMIRLQGTTHGMNSDQRLVPIAFTKTGPGAYSLTMNANPNILIPGLYWIYAVKANGTPSIGYPVQVFTEAAWPANGVVSVNLARGKAATQSSQWSDGAASRVVDGNQNGEYSGQSVNHTYADGQPWWQVDLGAAAEISQIKIWNRTDCCGDRLANFHVFVSNEPFAGSSVSQLQAQSGVTDLPYPGVAGHLTTLPVGRSGRYVRIQLSGSNYLHLAEVEVIGIPGAPPAPVNNVPAVSIVSPANNAVYTAPASLTINANASDPDGNLARVEFYNGATKLGEDTAAPFSYTWGNVAAGAYTLTVRAVDAAGLFASATVNVVVNQPAPQLSAPVSLAIGKTATQSSQYGAASASRAVDGDINGSWGGNSINHTYNDAQPWWQVDLGAVSNISEVKLWNRTDCCADRLANFHVFVSNDPFTGTSVAQTQAQAGVLDLYHPGVAGRSTVFPVGRTGRYLRVQLSVSNYLHLAEVEVMGSGGAAAVNNPPAVSIAAPANNAAFTAPASIIINANASDPDNNLARVEFYNGASKLGEDTTAPFSFTWNNVAAGGYTLTAKAVDTAGLMSSASVNVVVSAPANGAPAVSILTPANNTEFAAPASITIAANASDPNGNLARVEFYSGAVKLGEDTAAPFSFTWNNVAAGAYALTAKAVDTAGLSSQATVNVVVNGTPVLTPVNLALGRNATQSSQWETASASRAVDGNTNGAWTGGSLNHTLNNSQAWWQVDLGAVANITEIRVWNRSDCCAARLANFHVLVSNDAFGSASLAQTQAQPGVLDLHYPGIAGRTTVFPVNRSGRFVRIQLTGADYLHLAEVEVIGGAGATLAAAVRNGGSFTGQVREAASSEMSEPAVSIVWPSNYAVYTAPASITLGAVANGPEEALTRVQFFHGEALIADFSSAPYNFTWNGVEEGNYTITAKATRADGQITTTAVQISVEQARTVVAEIVNAASGLCLEAMIQKECDGSGQQKFRLSPVSGFADTYTIATGGNVCLDVSDDLSEQAPVTQSSCTGAPSQQFRAEKQQDGTYRLLSVFSGKALRVRDASTSAGAPVVQYTWSGVSSQKWQIAGLP